MATPASPYSIAMSDVNTELGLGGSSTISLGDTSVRTLAGISSGTISMNDLRGKSNRVSLSYPLATGYNLSINVSQIPGYITGKSDITISVDSSVVIYSTLTSSPALTISGASSGDTLVLVNNGIIVGCGGTGGKGGGNAAATNPTPGGSGGTAISAGCSFSITNNGTIGGGGGGGAGGYSSSSNNAAGGGGGGGAGYGSGGPAGTPRSGTTTATTGNNGTSTTGGTGGTAPSGSYAGRTGGGLGAYGDTMPSVTIYFVGNPAVVPAVPGGAPGTSIVRNGYTVSVSGSGSVYN